VPGAARRAGAPRGTGPTPSIAGHALDAANAITLAGLCSGVVGIVLATRGRYPWAAAALLWAVLLDWWDGPVARRSTGRGDDMRAFGAALDSLVDIVTMGVLPAVLVVGLAGAEPWAVVVACVVLVAAALRLAYFDVHGLAGGEAYTGLPLDLGALALGGAFLAMPALGPDRFAVVVGGLLVLAAALEVSRLRFPKLAGAWLGVVTAYVLVVSAILAAQGR
jgi:CDP-diacylglycerol--serine O-phosphatidyltransferase